MPEPVFTDAYRELLRLMVEARKEAGVTQVQLAERLGSPQPFVSYFERGERRVDVVEFVAIARALGIEPEALFTKLVSRLPDEIEI